MAHSCFWIVDVQQALIKAIPEKERSDLINILSLLLAASEKNILPSPHFFLQNSQKLGTSPFLQNNEYMTTEKDCFSCLQGMTGQTIKTLLKETQCTKVILTGIEAHICILLTAEDLLKNGIEVIIPREAIMSLDYTMYLFALQELQSMGCRVTSVETLISSCIASYQSPHFPWLLQKLKEFRASKVQA